MSWGKAKILQQRFRLHSVIVLIYKVILTVAAAEAAIGLAILVVFFRNRGSIAVEDVNVLKG